MFRRLPGPPENPIRPALFSPHRGSPLRSGRTQVVLLVSRNYRVPHVHIDDAPFALAILRALLQHRRDHQHLGYWPDEDGAEVDWDLLTTGTLSTTEQATIQIAWACSIMESQGSGVPLIARSEVRAAIDVLTGTSRG